MTDSTPGHRHTIQVTFAITILILVAGLLFSLRLGAWDIPFDEILRVPAAKLFGLGGDLDPAIEAIVWHGRLPRTLTGALVGFALGCAGTIMQGLFRNPMASPGVIGTSSGAALGAVTAIYFGFSSTNILAVPFTAVLFAFLSMVVVLLIATTGGLTARYTLLLAGIAFNAIFGALTSLVIMLSTDEFAMTHRIVGWLMGDLTNRSWEHVQIVLPIVVLGTLAARLQARELNLLMLSEDTASNLGVTVVRTRATLLFIAATLTGGAIAVAGTIGFVGLIAPHIMRRLVGSDHRPLIPAAGLLGALLVVIADCAVRFGEGELRIGVLTALLGGPFFLFLILSDRKKSVGL